MKAFLFAYGASLLTFLVVDAVWLGVIAKRFYAEQLGGLMRPDILFLPAGVFYLLYSVGIVVLAVRPEQPNLSLVNVAVYGALVGFIAYGTYNATNLATLRDWPATMSLVDMCWGVSVSAAMAVLGAVCARAFAH